MGAPFLRLSAITLALSLPSLLAQQAGQQPPASQTPPGQNPPVQTPPAKPKPANPFENVPSNTPVEAPKQPPAQPAKPQLENPAPVKPDAPTPIPASADTPSEDVLEAIEIRGSRRVPQDTLRALIISKKGDRYSEDSLNRDFMALWNTGRFDDIRLEREAGRTGWVI
ncbi:MAG: POTRA domain-containing protein, partial [Chloroflexia bacterium]